MWLAAGDWKGMELEHMRSDGAITHMQQGGENIVVFYTCTVAACRNGNMS